MTAGGDPTSEAVALDHPTEADQPAVAAVLDDWFGGRRVAHLAGRSWFRHAGSTSWLATDPAGHPVGVLIGYRSQDHPEEAVVHLIAVHPNRRRRSIGRRLLDAFVREVGAAGCDSVVALAWPGEPRAIAFFRGLGFEADDGPGSRNRWGMPAFPDHEGPGEDRIVFRRPVEARHDP